MKAPKKGGSKKKALPIEPTSVVREDSATLVQEIGAFAAKTHLSSILQKVAHGETFYVTKHGKPIAEIRPIATPVAAKRKLGDWKGRMWMAPDFDAPLEDFKEYME